MTIPYKNPGDSLTASEWNIIFAAADAILTNYLGGLSPLFFGEKGDPRKFFFFNPLVPPSTGLHSLAPAWLASAAAYPDGMMGRGYFRQYNHGAITSLVDGLALSWDGIAAFSMAAISFNAHGNGYTVGDILVPTGGTAIVPAQLKVTAVYGNGQILTVQILNPGYYTVAPANNNSVTGGTGVYCQLSFTWSNSKYNPFAVTRLADPTNAAWHAAVFPENGYGVPDSNYGGTINLDICLSILTRNGNAVTLGSGFLAGSANGFACSQGVGEVEIAHNYDAVEIIVAGDLAYDASWNKYSAFRIHNFAALAVTAFGMVIPPGGCKCVRRVNGNLVAGYNYFHAMQSGDPRFWANPLNIANHLCPFNTAALIATLGLPAGNGVPGNSLDLSKAWEMSAFYTALLAPPAATSVIFDLLCGFGNVNGRTALAVSVVAGGTGYTNGAYGQLVGGAGVGTYEAYATLHTGPGGAVVSATLNNGGNYTTIPTNPVGVTYVNGSGALFNLTFPLPLAFTGWASLAAFFASVGCTWTYNPTTKKATIAGTAGVLNDLGTNLIKMLTATLLPPVHTLNIVNTVFDLSAASTFNRVRRLIPTVTDTVVSWDNDENPVLVVHNAGCTVDPTDTVPFVGYTVADIVQKILDCLNALACALITLQNIQIRSTPFGPVLYWEEVYGINKNFNLSMINGGISRIVDGSKTHVILGKMFMIVGGFQNFFLPTAAPLLQIHFPRKGRVYQAQRAVIHNGADEPWQTNSGAYTTYEPPQLKRFFESQPVGTESPLPLASMSPVLSRPDGAGYMGPLDGVTVPPNAAESTLCEVEHFNALASQINGIPVTPAMKQIAPPGIPTYSPGGVPSPVKDSNGNYTTQPYFPRNCFYSWMAPASGPDATALAMTNLGLTVQTALPDGYGNPVPDQTAHFANGTLVVNSPSGFNGGFDSTFQAQAALYRWITIDDARLLYERLGMPFVLNAVSVPASFTVVTASPSLLQVSLSESDSVPSNCLAPTDTVAAFGCSSFPEILGGCEGYTPAPLEVFSASVYVGNFPTDPNTTYNFLAVDAQYPTVNIYQTIPKSLTTQFSFSCGDFGIVRAGFGITSGGNWATTFGGQNLSSQTPPPQYIFSPYLKERIDTTVTDGTFNSTAQASNAAGVVWLAGTATSFILWHVARQEFTSQNYIMLDWGILNDFTFIGNQPVNAAFVLIENSASQCAVVLPRNYAYNIVPAGTVVVNNSQEDSLPQVILIDGSGALGPETLITCAAANANLITFPINNTFAA